MENPGKNAKWGEKNLGTEDWLERTVARLSLGGSRGLWGGKLERKSGNSKSG